MDSCGTLWPFPSFLTANIQFQVLDWNRPIIHTTDNIDYQPTRTLWLLIFLTNKYNSRLTTITITTMNPDTDPVFSELLPTASFLLVYSLPLLLISLLLNFAGAFLTLDRSRSFPPQNLREYTHALTRYDKIIHLAHQFLQTGLGGWATGYTFAGASTVSIFLPSFTS